MSSESTPSSAPLCKPSSDGYHLPSKASIAKLLLACTMALSHLSPTEALSSLLSYDVRFLPLSSTDQGNGINSVAFNSPYSSIRQTVTQNAPSVRLNFEGVPQIPVGATLQSFSWTQNNQGDYKLPSWLTIVQSWSDNSPNFVLQLNGTDHLIANKQQDMAIVDLVGSVAYSHGPTRFIETEARAARLIVHLQLAQDISKRPVIGQYFNRLADSEGGYKVFENKATTTVIPPFTIETGEVYNLKCGNSESDGCILGTPVTNDPNSANDINKAPYWADEYSQISIKAGTAKIVSPLALYGAIFEVAKGATVVFEGASSTTAFSLISPSNVNTFINNGDVIVRKGILRLTGTSMTGLGSITVEEGATLEIDSEQEATFGTVDTATPASTKKPIIRNKGNVVFVSGHTRVVGAIVSTGTASITIGMAAKVTLVGGTNNATTVTHVLGGLFDGKDTITSTNGLNAVGTVINGALVIDKYATALVGAGIRVQGLGSITNEYYGTLKINIDFYDPVNFPNAAIIATGPASERTSPGITNGGALVIEKGGLKLATGFSNISNGTIDISEKGYLHFTSAGAINTIKGNYLSNKGDISLTSDAKVTFSLALQSYSSIKGYTSGTAIIFSGSTNSVITRPAGKKIGTSAVPDASHLFALFTVGAVLIKDSARVRIVAPEATNGDQESPRFYAAIVQNAGYLDIDANAVFETVSYSQNFQVSTVSEPLETYSYPYVGLLGDNAALKVTTPEKYALSSTTGLIAQVDPTKITGSKLPLEIVAGAIGGVNNSLFDGTISLGADAVALPGSVFSTERVDSKHEFLDGNGNTTGDKTQKWMNILRQTRSAGRIIAKELKLVSGSTIALDLAHLGGAGIGYDQLDIAGEVSLGGGILNISTTFESLAYASSTLETFSLSARGKYSTYATATVLEDMNNRGKKSKAQAQVPKRIAKMNALSIVNQYVNGKQVFSVENDEKSGNLDDKKADLAAVSSLVEKTDLAATSNIVENKSTAIAKIANAKEIFRLPIITSSSLKIDERFSQININWIPTDPNTAGKYTTMNVNTGKRELNKSVSSLIDQEMFTTLSKKLAQHYNTLQYSATFEGEPPLDPSLKKPIEFTEHVDPLSLNVGDLGKSKLYLAVEYNGGNVVLVGYEDGKGGSTSDATRVSSTSALMIGMATMAVAMLAMLF